MSFFCRIHKGMNRYLLHSDDLAFGQITRAFLVQPDGGRTRTGYAGTQTHPPTAPGFPSETRGVLKVADIDSYPCEYLCRRYLKHKLALP